MVLWRMGPAMSPFICLFLITIITRQYASVLTSILSHTQNPHQKLFPPTPKPFSVFLCICHVANRSFCFNSSAVWLAISMPSCSFSPRSGLITPCCHVTWESVCYQCADACLNSRPQPGRVLGNAAHTYLTCQNADVLRLPCH